MSEIINLGRSEIPAVLSAGDRLSREGRYAEAETCARHVIAQQPGHAMAHNNLGFAREKQDDAEEAIAEYQKALEINPKFGMAHRNLALLFARLGRRAESFALCHAELCDPNGGRWLQETISNALIASDLDFSAEVAAISAALRMGTRWYPRYRDPALMPFPVSSPPRTLTIPKLRHDIEQFEYLQRRGVFGDELDPITAEYRRVIEGLLGFGDEPRVPLENENFPEIADYFNRIINIRDTPRVLSALSTTWDPVEVEKQYLGHRPGVVVVDDFLSAEALSALRAFCLESTFWSGNRYAHGRLGAFFYDGFNCPLLVQMSEELRRAMPRVIGDRHSLRQMWGFKNSPFQPGDTTTHADFAAVNVNIWITPDEANLDSDTGGLIVYDVDAPPNWDFSIYNGRSDIIKPFLKRHNARALTVPYRQNRAIIFNSDLFHGTDTVRFRSEYENRRINVTLLYGVREEDHRHLALPEPATPHVSLPAWRSAAFARKRLRG